MKRLHLLSCPVLLLASYAAAQQSWTIANNEISRTVNFSETAGLVTTELTDLRTYAKYIEPGRVRVDMAKEFWFQCNGRGYSGGGSQFTLVNKGDELVRDGKSLVIRLRAKDVPLEVTAVYSVYGGQPATRKRLVFRNVGTVPLHLSHLRIEDLAPSVGLASETTLNTEYGAIPREIFYTGRSEDAALLIANGHTGVGLAVLSEVPGYTKRTEIAGWDDTEHVRIGAMYDTDLMPFERTLAPGEEFTTAAVSLVAFKNGDGYRDPHWVLPSYTARVLMRKVDAAGAPWIYNTWEPFERGINRDTVMQLIEVAGNIGMDIFTIDDGWQQEYGENEVNLTAFPGGLKPIQDAVEAKGMRLGLWIPLAAIGATTADYRKHPEWAAMDLQGKQKTTGTAAGEKIVMCMASPFRDAAADRVNDAIERYHLAYVKLDLTTIFNAYGEAPGCWAKGHDHGDWAESLNLIYEGIAHVTQRIYAKHPDVLLDLTFELWGQKHVIDAGLLAAGDLDWMSNVDDRDVNSAGTLQARTLLYQRAVSMPAEAMLIGNIHAGLPSLEESFATEIGSAPLFLGDLRKLSAEDQKWLRERIAWFKKLRKSTPISESFFPLGIWLQPTPAKWDGFARLARSGDGVIAVFRNKSGAASAELHLPLIPEGKYKVRSVVTGKELGEFTKADWVKGVKVEFAGAATTEILEVTAEK